MSKILFMLFLLSVEYTQMKKYTVHTTQGKTNSNRVPKHIISFVLYKSCSNDIHTRKQAGAELSQAQLKLELELFRFVAIN